MRVARATQSKQRRSALEDVVDGFQRSRDGRGPPPRSWRRDPGALTRLTPRSVVVLTETSPEPVCVSGVAFVVWHSVHDEPTTDELIERVVQACGLRASSIEPAVRSALHDLVELGAVVPR
jgi:hypothetical protein